MDESAMAGQAILFALGREARPFLRHFSFQNRIPSAPCPAYVCGLPRFSMLVMQTGVGRERVDKALDWLLGKPARPRLVVSAGFSGALREDLRVGDVIVATEVVGPDEVCRPVTWARELPAVGETGLYRGRLLTVDRSILYPADKLALARRHGAVAVDMETAFVARRCTDAAVPFACIRAISDDAHDALPAELDYVIDNGRLSYRRLGISLLRRPRLAAKLWRLARNTRIAADHLGEVLGRVFRMQSG